MPICKTPAIWKNFSDLNFEILTIDDAVAYFTNLEKRDHTTLVAESSYQNKPIFTNLETGQILTYGETHTILLQNNI